MAQVPFDMVHSCRRLSPNCLTLSGLAIDGETMSLAGVNDPPSPLTFRECNWKYASGDATVVRFSLSHRLRPVEQATDCFRKPMETELQMAAIDTITLLTEDQSGRKSNRHSRMDPS